MNKLIEENKAWIDSVWEKLEKKLERIAVKSRFKLPYTTINGVHDGDDPSTAGRWTDGFFGGMMWLMYEATGNEEFKKTALESEKLMDPVLKDFKALHHDVGFMWHLLCGANYRLTGNEEARNKNLFAAASLASRYNITAGYIRAWNGIWDNMDTAGFSIIDCLMNIPLLYWASEQVGDTRFKKIAMSHADMAIKDHIRPDGSVNHIVDHNTETGEVVRTLGGQGYGENSCWTRGLAWAVYGTVLSYIHTGKKDYLDAAIKTASYFVANCAANNYLTPVDFKAPTEPEYYDSTAGLCTACGLLELAKYVSEGEAAAYTDAAIKILKATDEHFCNYDENEDSIVQMGTERYPLNGNMNGVHIPIIYGDFFFTEAILKLRGRQFLIW